MMHEGKQNMQSMYSAALLVSKPNVPRFQRSPNSKHQRPRCNAGEKQNIGGKLCNARIRHAKGSKAEAVKPNLHAREDRSRKQCMQCKL